MSTYVVGIDLGTTHCAVAFSPVEKAEVELLSVPQLVAPGEVGRRPLLPSFMYLPAPGELPEAQLTLPWGPAEAITGTLARARGAKVPNRLVASAKSWICHGGVNRKAPILPWSAPDAEPHVSPFEAQVRYLSHLRAAWDHAHPGAPLADQDVVVTVPASFDEVARELTAEAAREAGLRHIRLLEEPQAAFYDYLGSQADLRDALGAARLALVVDIGGGTTDLTLVRVHPGEGDAEPTLERIAVGGHLMLGGDNMDAALAHHVLAAAFGERARLDPTEWSALVQAARDAKERLLGPEAPESARVPVQRRGSRLIGGTKTVTLTRGDVEAVFLDGFFPQTQPDEVAGREARAGLTTLGLPYTSDPGVPRHVNAFLRKHAEAAREAGAVVEEGLPRPDVVLLNGGVFNAPALVARFEAVLAGWYGSPVQLLAHTSLDTAVARGAARFALSKRGVGRAIAGGQARAYYVGVEEADGTRRALCIAPKGLEEGAIVDLPRVFRLVLDRPVSFALYTYDGDRHDDPGAVIPVGAELDALPAFETLLRKKPKLWVDPDTGTVPVRLTAGLTEAGTLDLSLVTVELPPRRWKLALAVDVAEAPAAAPARTERAAEVALGALPKDFGEARRVIQRIYGAGRVGGEARSAKALRKELEGVLGPRGQWSTTVCRGVWGVLHTVAEQRGRTPEHELNWLRLASWCLRPGFGARGDRDRVAAAWAIHDEGLRHPQHKATWNEWWLLWRRVAGGLGRDQQQILFSEVRPWLGGGRQPPVRAHGHPEMLRMLGALERLSAEQKQEAGAWLERHFKRVGSWWVLGRLGARQPWHGDPQDVAPTAVAEAWLERLLALDWSAAPGADFASVLLARCTGDAARDVSAALRRRVAERLGAADAPAGWIDMVSRVGDLSESDARRVFGDSLPAGLRLG